MKCTLAHTLVPTTGSAGLSGKEGCVCIFFFSFSGPYPHRIRKLPGMESKPEPPLCLDRDERVTPQRQLGC